MGTPWPDKPCPHCGKIITDLLSEMVPDPLQTTSDYAAIVGRRPGGAITCPFCQSAVEYAANGEDLVASAREPLRYSRTKMENRALTFGRVFLEKEGTTPEEWLAVDRGMVEALRGYRWAEEGA